MNNIVKPIVRNLYKELKTELAICRMGGLFLALYEDKNVPELIIARLQKDLPDYFQFPLQMTEKKVLFSIFFEQSFEHLGKQSNIYHVLGIETLSEKSKNELIQSLQYGRERFKALSYSIVFWVHPPFVKELFHAAPDFHHWVFGTYDFSEIELSKENVQVFHQENQKAFLESIDRYLKKLIWQYEHWQEVKNSDEEFLLEVMSRANLRDYYVKLYCTDKEGKVWLLDEMLDKFLAVYKENFMVLLGDFGTGKSSFSLHYFIIQANRYLQQGKSWRIPIFVSLKDYPGKFNVETFIINEFYDKFGLPFSLTAFQSLALQGKFLFFVDGFDEMVSMSNKQETIENFKELTKLSFENLQFMTQSENRRQTNKVFMTCRTHYFFTEVQEQDILKVDKTVLYRNYTTRSDYQVARINLKEFNQAQIEEYVLKSVGGNKETAKQVLDIIKDTYNLKELSTRPLLLEMIVKTLPELIKNKEQINVAGLYKVYTDMWIGRDDWRSQLTSQGKRKFMWELARKMYETGGNFSLRYYLLDKPKEEFLKSHIGNQKKDYYKYETPTCSFLNRDSSGNYKFIHKSFMEYFLAEYFFDCLKKHKTSSLSFQYSDTNDEVKFFLKLITGINHQGLDLSSLNLSFFILDDIDLTKVIFQGANLKGANLEKANLEEANLEGANLEGANFEKAILRKVQFGRVVDINKVRLVDANLVGANLEAVYLEEVYLKNTDLTNSCFKNANLKNANLQWTSFLKATLKGACLESANLKYADCKQANLEKANFKKAFLKYAHFEEANLTEVNFRNANLEETFFYKATLEGACFESANLKYADCRQTNLEGANFEKAFLKETNFEKANLITRVNFREANLEGTFFYKASLGEACFESANLKYADFRQATFEGANFEKANLMEANFEKANLMEVNFRNANLEGACFYKTDLKRACFESANLERAYCKQANLEGADFKKAKLKEVDFKNANLKETNFRNAEFKGANLEGANLEGANFEGAKNLEHVNFEGAKLDAKFDAIYHNHLNSYE